MSTVPFRSFGTKELKRRLFGKRRVCPRLPRFPIRTDCVNPTWRPLYQHLSHSKHQAVEGRRFLAGCGRK